MKKSLGHLPDRKKKELSRVVGRICERVKDLQMIILFGSHTSDKWVEDIYTKGGNTYEYISDFDILVVVGSNRTANMTNIWHRLDRSINAMGIQTPVTIIAHDINFVNKRIERAHYFFSDIKKEGIVLYDSGGAKLSRRRKLDAKERAEIAEKDFKQWFKSAKEFYDHFEYAFNKRSYKKAAFNLHQSVEAFYAAVLLVFTNYKPKSHDLKKLSRMANNHDRKFFELFPQVAEKEKNCFDLLNRAYVEARYEPDYKITKGQLEYLAERVRKLKRLTNKVCKERIGAFG